jgi:predicted transcriptional regulator
MGNSKFVREREETTLRLDGRLAKLVDLEAQHLRISRSGVVRLAVAEYLKARQMGLPPAAGGFIIPWESRDTMGERKRYEVQVTVQLPRQLRELIEKEALLFQISRSAVIRQALIFYFASRGLQAPTPKLGALEPQPPSSDPAGPGVIAMGAAGRTDPENGGDAPQPSFIKEKTGGGESG